MIKKMTGSEIIKELNNIGDIEKVTNPWSIVYYRELKEEYMCRIFQKNVFEDEYNHEDEKKLLKDIDIEKVFKNLGQ
jgi:hypothetical protein